MHTVVYMYAVIDGVHQFHHKQAHVVFGLGKIMIPIMIT